jgi:hypothetical protein
MTFGTMLDRIEDEILRTDLNSNVQSAIKSAIRHYESQRFWFTEGNNSGEVTTGSSNTATYTISAEWINIDSLTTTVASNEYQLIPRTADWFREINTNVLTVTGTPTDYAFHGNTFWLYPSPNSAYPLTIYGHRKITELDSSGDMTLTDTTVTNDWFTQAEEVIRCRAKYYLYADVLENPERAMFYGGEDSYGNTRGREGEALAALTKRTKYKISTGILQPEYF